MMKITKKEKMEKIIEVLKGTEVENKEMLLEFCQNEIEQYNKKSAKKTTENEKDIELMDLLYKALSQNVGKGYQVSKLQNEYTHLGIGTDVMTNQKASALLNKMVEKSKIQKTKDKKTTLFGIDIIEENEDEE